MNHYRFPWRLLFYILLTSVLLLTVDKSLRADITQPIAKLELINRLGGPVLAVAVQEQVAYVGHSFEFAILDLRDPSAPARIAWLPISSNDITLHGKYAYVAGRDGLSIVDITNKTQPVVVGSLSTSRTILGVALAGDYAYLIDGLGGFAIIDVSQPARPVRVSQQRIDQRAEGLVVVDHLAYVATYTGLLVLNVVDPANPRTLGLTSQPGWSQSVAVQGGYAYVSTLEGVAIIKIADPAHPIQVGLLPMAEYADGVQIVDNNLFVANATHGLRVFNLTQPARPRLISVTPLAGAMLDLAIANGYALFADVTTGNVAIVAVDDPSNPILQGTYRAPGMSTGVAVAGEYVYVAADTDGDIHLINIVDPLNLVESGFYQTKIKSRAVTVVDDLVYTFDKEGATEVLEASDLQQSMINEKESIQPLQWQPTDHNQNRHLLDLLRSSLGEVNIADTVEQGNYVYLALDKHGVAIIDVSRPATPKLVASYQTADAVQSLAVKNDTIFVADRFGGLLALRVIRSE